MSTQCTRTIIKVKVAELKPHPQQSSLFSGLSDEGIKELAEDMKKNGQLTPIEITPDNVIICGHQRYAAALLLGLTELSAWVRDDLPSEADVVIRMVEDNLTRQHLDPLSQARCYRVLKENVAKLPPAKRRQYQGTDTRDRLAKQFNMSGRSLDRLLRLLNTPIEVQRAVSANKLSMKAAGQVAGQKEDVQEAIAGEIGAGAPPEDVVKAHIPQKKGKRMLNSAATASFFRHLREDIPDMEARLPELEPFNEAQVDTLKTAKEVIDELINTVGVQKSSQNATSARTLTGCAF